MSIAHTTDALRQTVRRIRTNPDLTPTHVALALTDVATGLAELDARLARLEALHAKAEAVRHDWATGAKVPA